jgi:hypothetical protein
VSFTTAEGEEKSYRLFQQRPLRIGRDPANDVILRDAKVSRMHAEIIFERGFFVLHDLGSSNGSFVNGIRVRVAPLTDGVAVRLGNTSGTFSEELAAPGGTMSAKVDLPAEGQDHSQPAEPAGTPEPLPEPPPPPVASPLPVSDPEAEAQTTPQKKGDLDDLQPEGEMRAAVSPPLPVESIHERATVDEVPHPEPPRPFGTLHDDQTPAMTPLPSALPSALLLSRYFIDEEAVDDIAAVRDGDDRPLLYFKRNLDLIGFVANILAGIVTLSGVAAATFLVSQQRLFPALLAMTLTLLFAAVIVLLTPRRYLHVFANPEASRREFTLRQESRFPFPAIRYSALAADGAVFTVFQKLNLNPLGRRRWYVFDRSASLKVGAAIEDSLATAIARKVLGNFFRAFRPNYDLYSGTTICGEITRRTVPGRVEVDLTRDSLFSFDRRTAMALGILLSVVEK